jgi:hypothetical protein
VIVLRQPAGRHGAPFPVTIPVRTLQKLSPAITGTGFLPRPEVEQRYEPDAARTIVGATIARTTPARIRLSLRPVVLMAVGRRSWCRARHLVRLMELRQPGVGQGGAALFPDQLGQEPLRRQLARQTMARLDGALV